VPLTLGPQPLDSRRKYEFDLAGDQGASLAGVFTGSEVLVAKLWLGGSSPVLASPACSWLDAPNAKVLLEVAPADLLGLEPGPYRLEIRINPGTDDIAALPPGTVLRLSESPGTAEAPQYHVKYSVLEDLYPTIDQLHDREGRVGFLTQRWRARTWFEGLLHNAYRGGVGITSHQRALMGGGYRSGTRSPQLTQWLKDDRVLLTTDIVEMEGHYALSLILAGQLSAKEEESPYLALSKHHLYLAENIAGRLNVDIDTDGDGQADLNIDLGSVPVYRG
jgi:hypothetical protein